MLVRNNEKLSSSFMIMRQQRYDIDEVLDDEKVIYEYSLSDLCVRSIDELDGFFDVKN
jgi:hypothetical protein